MKQIDSGKSVKINIILNALKTMASIIFPLITFPYVSRILQAENIGKVQFAASIISYFSLLASLGISMYAIREGSAIRDDKEKLEKFCSQIFSFNVLSTIVAYIGIIILLIFMKREAEYKYLIIIQSMTIVFTTLGVDWINSIFEDFKYITIRSILIQFLTLILTFIFIRSSNDYYSYAIISVISSVGANILNIFYVRKYCKIKLTTNIEFKKHFKPIILLFSNYIASTIYKDADITMLGAMCGEYNVGIYYVAVKTYNIIKQLLNSIVAVIIPRISNYEANNQSNEKNYLLDQVLRIIILFTFPIITGLIMLKEQIILIIAGESYMDAVVPFIILSVSLFFAVLANFTSNMILIVHKKEKISLISTIIAATTNFILNIILIPVLKETGAAITTLIAEMLVALITGYHAYKYYKPQKMLRTILAVLVGCSFIVIIITFIRNLNLTNIFEVIISVFLSIIGYFVCIFLIDKKNFISIIRSNENK